MLGQGERRLLADVPADLHLMIRQRCLERGIEMRVYMLEAIAAQARAADDVALARRADAVLAEMSAGTRVRGSARTQSRE